MTANVNNNNNSNKKNNKKKIALLITTINNNNDDELILFIHGRENRLSRNCEIQGDIGCEDWPYCVYSESTNEDD